MSAMCSQWARQGHDVQVITCAPNVPDGAVYEGYKNKLCQRETINDVKVTRVWTYITANKGTLKRIINYVSFMVTAVIASWFRKRPDIIIATSPQFFCGWAGLLASRLRLRRIPFILEIRDLWPDSIVAVGAMKEGSRLLKILYQLEKWMYAGATHIVTVGEGYWQELIEKNVPGSKISIIPNGIDKHLFEPMLSDPDVVEQYGLENRTSCAYIGTIGMAAGLDVMLDAARELKLIGRDDIRLLAIGDGAERESLQKQAEEQGFDNLIFTGRLPKEQIPGMLASVDICFVHLKKCDLFKRVMPSKIFEMAAMQRPIILGVEGFASKVVQEAKAGVCIEPENAENLVATLCELADHPRRCGQYGRDGREYMLANYDREVLSDEYLDILRNFTYNNP